MASLQNEMEMRFYFKLTSLRFSGKLSGLLNPKAAVSVFRTQFCQICHTVEGSMLGYKAFSV